MEGAYVFILARFVAGIAIGQYSAVGPTFGIILGLNYNTSWGTIAERFKRCWRVTSSTNDRHWDSVRILYRFHV